MCSTSPQHPVTPYPRPTVRPTVRPSHRPSVPPSVRPTVRPTVRLSHCPSHRPSHRPSVYAHPYSAYKRKSFTTHFILILKLEEATPNSDH